MTIAGTLVRSRKHSLMRQDHPKHSKGWRIVALPPFTARALLARLKCLGEPIDAKQTVFCTKKGTYLAPANIRRTWRAVRDAVGDELPEGIDLAGVVPHTLRKTVATTLDGAPGGGIDLAAELLGHSSTSVTEAHYVQPIKRVNAVTAQILQTLGPDEQEGLDEAG